MSDLFRLEDDAPMRRALYTTAFLFIFIPFLQAMSQFWPLRLSSIEWRLGAANALSAVLLLPFLGCMILLYMGRVLESRAASRTAAVLATIFTIGLAASFVLFLLDALQFKAIVTSAQAPGFRNVMMRVSVVSVVFTIAFALLAVAGFRMPKRPLTKARKTVPADEGVGLVVGR